GGGVLLESAIGVQDRYATGVLERAPGFHDQNRPVGIVILRCCSNRKHRVVGENCPDALVVRPVVHVKHSHGFCIVGGEAHAVHARSGRIGGIPHQERSQCPHSNDCG